MEQSFSGNGAMIVRDHGCSGWMNLHAFSNINMGLGYSRSISYPLNTIFFSVGFDAGTLLTSK